VADSLNIISYWQSGITADEYPIESSDCIGIHKNITTLIFNYLSILAMLSLQLFQLSTHAHFQHESGGQTIPSRSHSSGQIQPH